MKQHLAVVERQPLFYCNNNCSYYYTSQCVK